MSFVEEEYQVIALYPQNELHQVEPGNKAEFTLKTPRPDHQGEGRFDRLGAGPGPGAAAGTLPQTGVYPACRAAFRSSSWSKSGTATVPAAGAAGHGAIYTEHVAAIQILRKVILRVGAIIDYLVLKLH